MIMKTNVLLLSVAAALATMMPNEAKAQLHVGGYGEAAYSRNFYSDHVSRYSLADEHKDDPSHGRFDIPHAVVYLSYDFGKGWSMGSEIEFEHGGVGMAYEKEDEEGGEWEQEVEKGGEVELEQFWIQKSFGRFANIRVGHIVVPVGLTNAHHEPLNFFTVYRPEGENTILPCTWHQTGVSFWGRSGDFRYELQMIAGLDAWQFSRDGWIKPGTTKPFEFETANKYGFSARVDNYTVPGLRVGLSGYYGQSMHNAVPHDMETGRNKNIKGNVYVGAFDFTYNAHNWIARGNADYGYVSDAKAISAMRKPGTQYVKPYESNQVFGSNAIATSFEIGYDIFSQIAKLRADKQKLYVFGHFEYYNSCLGGSKQYTSKKIFAGGINYYPVPQVCVKAEYSYRKLKQRYNDEPAINIGVAYQGMFL